MPSNPKATSKKSRLYSACKKPIMAAIVLCALFALMITPVSATESPLPTLSVTATKKGAKLVATFPTLADAKAAGGITFERTTPDYPNWNWVHTYDRPVRRRVHTERWIWLGTIGYRACLANAPTRCTQPQYVVNDGSYGTGTACGDETDALVLGNVNAFRAKHGLFALRNNAQLNQAANARAQYVARLGYLTHDGYLDAVNASGYKYWWAGEWLHGYVSADRVVDGWIGSQPHRDAMLWDFYPEVGIGCARSGTGGLFWSMIAGAPR